MSVYIEEQASKPIGRIAKAAKNRYVVLSLVTAVGAFAVLARLFSLQIIDGARYAASSQATSAVRRIAELAPRGGIFDRNGVPIAIDGDTQAVHIVDSGQDNDALNASLLRIARTLTRNSDSWISSFERRLAFTSGGGLDGLGAVSFPDGAQSSSTESWATGMLGMSESEAQAHCADAESLFAYICSDSLYDIDPAYSPEEAYRIASLRYLITESRGAFEQGQSVRVATDVSGMTVAELLENSREIGGVDIESEPVRKYIDADSVAHVLGYVGEISEAQLEEMRDDGYAMGDVVGKFGVEAQNEAYLRGRNGEKRVEVGEGGATAAAFAGEPAIPGSDITLTIDMELQKIAYESLERNIGIIREGGDNGYFLTDSEKNLRDADSGSAVAVDVRTGEVILMANFPTFSPSIFLAGRDDAEAQAAIAALWDDPLRSALNRAAQGIYAPGSTFKPVTAIAALQEGVITPNSTVYDAGRINIGGRDLFCLEGGHGSLTLKTALETSCNVFFYDIGYRTTIANLHKWAGLFGLGVRTGIDLPYEEAGMMSSQALKMELFSDIWRPADTAQVSIGQLYNAFTPLQMACYMSALANGGDYYKPYVTKEVTRYDGSSVRETAPESRRIPVDAGNIDAVKEGMVASTTEIDGTSAKAFTDFPIAVAGKTGTAETGLEAKQSSNAVFVCYAPADNPQIALAVVVEKGAWGSYAAPIARDILEAYFGISVKTAEDDFSPSSASGLVIDKAVSLET